MRPFAVAFAFALALGSVLAGCVSPPSDVKGASVADDASSLLAMVPDAITGLEPAGRVEFGAGNDLAFHSHYAFVATHNNGMHVIDIADPKAPVEVATVPCNGKDINSLVNEGRVLVTISSQSDDKCPQAAPKGGIRVVDVTNATMPVVMGQVALAYGSHTNTPYGDTGLVYNSAYNLAGDPTKSPMDHHRSEIVDVRDPAHPTKVAEFMFPATSSSIGCHDILAEPERNRAICAGISETMIWDTTDPMKPKIVSTIRNPLISIHHSAATTHEGKLLVLGDEFAGVLAPACHPAKGAPTGALWFYDISNAASPQLLGFFPPMPDTPGKVCTAHNFNIVEGKDMVVAGFYSSGTLLVDFKDPKAPKLVSQQKQEPTSSWATYYYRGAVFSGDGVRGFDSYVLK